MPRIPQVTRTITTTLATVLCLDLESGNPVTMTVRLPRTYKAEAKVLKAARKKLESDKLKVAHVSTYKAQTKLYVMTEERFVEEADELPPRSGVQTETQPKNQKPKLKGETKWKGTK